MTAAQTGKGHTPGPWAIRWAGNIIGTSDPNDGTVIATVNSDANAHLIAAAPALLEALLESIAFVEQFAQGPSDVLRSRRRVYEYPAGTRPAIEVLADARAAIRLTEGHDGE